MEHLTNITYNMDCMEYMKSVPDKYFDLAVVDPPYGGGSTENAGGGATEWKTPRSDERGRFGGRFDKYYIGNSNGRNLGGEIPPTMGGLTAPEIKAERTGCGHNKYYIKAPDIKAHRASDAGGDHKSYKKEYGGNDIRNWDVAPPPEYFKELARVSKNQIIWGGNYFYLPPTRCFLVWRKLTISETFTMAMAEYAWTSFNDNAKVFEFAPQGSKNDPRFHPTAKPIELYSWIYRLYAKPGDKILDTHLGSGSSRIAAYKAGLNFVGCEIDKVYFDLEERRFQEVLQQGDLLAPYPNTNPEQLKLF